jgi:CubicO group peptidase (beta-lactamase class C family)
MRFRKHLNKKFHQTKHLMKKTIFMLAICIAACYAANAQQVNKLTTEFDKVIQKEFQLDQTGVTVLISSHGNVIYKKAFGMADIELNVPMKTNNVFRIGSITKQFTAIAILQLMEKGKLHLQDEVTRFIPNYPMQGSKITIEHLLTHTSGIPDFTSMKDSTQRFRMDFTPIEMIHYFQNQPMRFVPGSRHEYSNSNYFLLGYIIEMVTGKTYQQYLEENFFQPLGMSNSFYGNDTIIIKNRASGYTKSEGKILNATFISMSQPYAAGSILSTVEDLFKWQHALITNKLVRKESLEKAFTRYKLSNGQEVNYGYGFRMGFIQGSPSIWHGGLISGFFSMAMYLPKEEVFVTVLSNCDCNSPADITAKLAALVIGMPYEHKQIAVTKSTLQTYAGVYENSHGQQRIITVSGDVLDFQIGNGPKLVIKAYKNDQFFFDNGDLQSIEFKRKEKGDVEMMIVKNRVSNEVWTKTNKLVSSKGGIKVDETILETYVGVYQINPDFSFTVTTENSKVFLQAKGQEKLEMFATTPTTFFLNVNDAVIEFVNESGKVSKVILRQGGRTTEATKIK